MPVSDRVTETLPLPTDDTGFVTVAEFKSLFHSEKNWLVIEIGERRIRIAECRRIRGKQEIIRLVGADIPSVIPTPSPVILRNLLDSNNIRSRRVVLNIPRYLVLVKFLKLPSTDPVEIRQMAKIEALRQVPYNEDEMIGSHKIIRPEADGYTLVLIVSVLRSVIDRWVSILKNCDLLVEKITLGAELLQAWCLENYPGLKNKNVMLVGTGADTLDVQVLEEGHWVFSRGILLDRRESHDALLSEVAASVSAYQNASSKKLQEICFCGTTEAASRLRTLSEEMQLPLRALDSGGNVGSAATAFAEIDLMPPPLLRESRMHSIQRSAASALAWATLFFVFLGGALLKKSFDERKFLSFMDAEIKKNKPRVEEAAKMRRLLEAVRGHAGSKPLSVDVFTEIHRILPEGVSLELLDYEDRDTLTLRGSADHLSAAFECAKALEKAALFSAVRVRYVTKRVVNGQEAADFEIQAKIREGEEHVKSEARNSKSETNPKFE